MLHNVSVVGFNFKIRFANVKLQQIWRQSHTGNLVIKSLNLSLIINQIKVTSIEIRLQSNGVTHRKRI